MDGWLFTFLKNAKHPAVVVGGSLAIVASVLAQTVGQNLLTPINANDSALILKQAIQVLFLLGMATLLSGIVMASIKTLATPPQTGQRMSGIKVAPGAKVNLKQSGGSGVKQTMENMKLGDNTTASQEQS